VRLGGGDVMGIGLLVGFRFWVDAGSRAYIGSGMPEAAGVSNPLTSVRRCAIGSRMSKAASVFCPPIDVVSTRRDTSRRSPDSPSSQGTASSLDHRTDALTLSVGILTKNQTAGHLSPKLPRLSTL